VATVLGSGKTLKFKNVGSDCIIDLSALKPGEVSAELLVIKLKGAL
jgi:alpha-L-fucosidase